MISSTIILHQQVSFLRFSWCHYDLHNVQLSGLWWSTILWWPSLLGTQLTFPLQSRIIPEWRNKTQNTWKCKHQWFPIPMWLCHTDHSLASRFWDLGRFYRNIHFSQTFLDGLALGHQWFRTYPHNLLCNLQRRSSPNFLWRHNQFWIGA